jgi:hypothetical protein
MPTYKQAHIGLISPGGPSGVIGSALSVDLNSVSSVPISILSGGTKYMITNIIITHASAAPLVAATGNFTLNATVQFTTNDISFGEGLQVLYTPSNYISLLGTNGIFFQDPTSRYIFTDSTMYFALVTPEGSPLTADIFVYGVFIS